MKLKINGKLTEGEIVKAPSGSFIKITEEGKEYIWFVDLIFIVQEDWFCKTLFKVGQLTAYPMILINESINLYSNMIKEIFGIRDFYTLLENDYQNFGIDNIQVAIDECVNYLNYKKAYLSRELREYLDQEKYLTDIRVIDILI